MNVAPGEIRIMTGHALDLIEDVEAIDLLVTDPPYAFGAQGKDEHAISATVATVLRESAKRLRKGHWAIVFAASSWRSTAYMIEACRGVLEPVRFGTWAKVPGDRPPKLRTTGWSWSSVNVILMRKPGPTPVGVAVPDLDYVVAQAVKNGRRAQLPESVAQWAVKPFVVPGGLALDPFAGTGTLLRPAADAGMAALGFDRDATVGLTTEVDDETLEPTAPASAVIATTLVETKPLPPRGGPQPVLAAKAWPTNADLIADVAKLGYIRPDDLVADVTYGRGVWWKQYRPARLVAADLVSPKADLRVDFRHLPMRDATFDVVAYDPPFVSVGGRTTTGLPDMQDRYGLTDAPASPAELRTLIAEGLRDVHRVLKPGGVALCKAQAYVSSGKLFLGNVFLLQDALDLGFECVDWMERIGSPRPQPERTRQDGQPVRQHHARRNMSSLFVLKKR